MPKTLSEKLSVNQKLRDFKVDDQDWVEVDGPDEAARVRSRINTTYRSAAMKGWKFSTAIFTVVSPVLFDKVKYLVRICRIR
jgi:hypothetical protein